MTFLRERLAAKQARVDELGALGRPHADDEFDHNEAFGRHLLDQWFPVATAWQTCARCGEDAVLAEVRIATDITADICGACAGAA